MKRPRGRPPYVSCVVASVCVSVAKWIDNATPAGRRPWRGKVGVVDINGAAGRRYEAGSPVEVGGRQCRGSRRRNVARAANTSDACRRR